MPWPFLLWLLCLVCQTASLGCSLYQLVQLTDVELDNINPHDASRNYNSMVIPGLFLEMIFCGLLLVGRNWFLAIPAMLLVGYDVLVAFDSAQGNGKIDVTEIFRMLRPKRSMMTKKTILGMFMFAWTLYRFIECLIHSLISNHGRDAAQKVLREAAATLYH